VDEIERSSGVRFIRMEMGVPGLSASPVGIEAEIAALKSGKSSNYPNIQGVPEFKEAVSRFIQAFLGLSIGPEYCIPATGSTNASFLSLMVAGRRSSDKQTTLFLDPGFSVHKLQVKSLGLQQRSLDVYDYRGAKLRPKLKELLAEGHFSTLLYSNPNNPSWICFTDEELQAIGETAEEYGVIVMEDLAYFGMDFRQDYSVPGVEPFQPTVASYTDQYILLISSSKLFSYAGHRIGVLAVSPALFESRWPDLKRYYSSDQFGHGIIFGASYAVAAGVNFSSQMGLAAILNAATNGTTALLDDVKVYGRRASRMKTLFLSNGFQLVYDRDVDRPIGDGFYFTVSYPGLTGEELVRDLLPYGISAISLATTGSVRSEGIRACVSLISDADMPELEKRLSLFDDNHRKGS
jgi:aspartate/methionine/tyrosine aminotransferase